VDSAEGDAFVLAKHKGGLRVELACFARMERTEIPTATAASILAAVAVGLQ